MFVNHLFIKLMCACDVSLSSLSLLTHRNLYISKFLPDWLQWLLTSQCSAIIGSMLLISDKAVAYRAAWHLTQNQAIWTNKVPFVLQINEVSGALSILDRQMYLLP